MPNPTSALVPNVIVSPNIPNTGTGVLILPANPARNGLLISNISANIMWLFPGSPSNPANPAITGVSGTVQSGQVILAAAAAIYFGSIATGLAAGTLFFVPWVWTQSMFALAAAGASNIVTILEF
jgi:hypothetical protein